ncbi:hypothetical protein McanMca71_005380 [Microsporum canis]
MHVPWSLNVVLALSGLIVCQTLPKDPSGPDDPPAFPGHGELGTEGNWLGIRLFKYSGCDSGQQKKINDAYWDMYKILDTPGVGREVDFNSAAALEFFGPPALNRNEQKGILRIVRCDDPSKLCTHPEDPCQPNNRRILDLATAETVAYSANRDSESGYPRINFCPIFFNNAEYPYLQNAVAKGVLPAIPNGAYTGLTQAAATIFLHEMCHLDLAVGSPDKVPHIRDISIVYEVLGSEGEKYETGIAYGPRLTKILARMDLETGKWVQRNADNFALFATAKHVQKALGNIYPHYPVVAERAEIPPDLPPPQLTTFTRTSNGAVFDYSPGVNGTYCGPGDVDLTKRRLISDSTYPAAYRKEKALKIEALWPSSELKGKNLKILPLGGTIAPSSSPKKYSITFGYGSSHGNGYRGELLGKLSGNFVDMIGSVKSGNMADNDNEGHSGAVIDGIASHTGAYSQKPNIVLLHAGTNDMNNPTSPNTAPARLGSLIDQILRACPDAVVLVALIIPATNADTNGRINLYNDEVASIVKSRFRSGKHVLLVDMNSMLTDSHLGDGLHPNDEGYSVMADAWFRHIKIAEGLGWIKTASNTKPREECPRLPTWIEQGQIANGAGLGGDTPNIVACGVSSVHSSNCVCFDRVTNTTYNFDQGSPPDCPNFFRTHAVRFADLNGDGRDEYLYVDSRGAVTAFQNLGWKYVNGTTGTVTWWPKGKIAAGVGTLNWQIHFADINGDGRADYLSVEPDGSVKMWLNVLDDPSDISKITWVQQGTIATGIGKPGVGVRFADINGDGRAEYLYVDPVGAVTAYLNAGFTYGNNKDGTVVWIPQGLIATGVGPGRREDIIFTDINGDGRADYLWTGERGSVKLWQNLGGPDNGPNAAKVTWWERGLIASGSTTYSNEIVFGDVTGDGRADYLWPDLKTSAVKAWVNGC